MPQSQKALQVISHQFQERLLRVGPPTTKGRPAWPQKWSLILFFATVRSHPRKVSVVREYLNPALREPKHGRLPERRLRRAPAASQTGPAVCVKYSTLEQLPNTKRNGIASIYAWQPRHLRAICEACPNPATLTCEKGKWSGNVPTFRRGSYCLISLIRILRYSTRPHEV